LQYFFLACALTLFLGISKPPPFNRKDQFRPLRKRYFTNASLCTFLDTISTGPINQHLETYLMKQCKVNCVGCSIVFQSNYEAQKEIVTKPDFLDKQIISNSLTNHLRLRHGLGSDQFIKRDCSPASPFKDPF